MKPRRQAIASVLLVAASACTPAFAQHASVELATGGLVFPAAGNLELRSEQLFIGLREIKVVYRISAKAPERRTLPLTFPMPDIRFTGPDEEIALPTQDPENLLGFFVTANGAPVATRVEQTVVAADVDHTALLRSLGVPLAPQLAETGTALDGLPRAQWADLVRLGLAEIAASGPGRGNREHLLPRWTLRTTYTWEQEFAPDAETVLTLTYKPSVGEKVETGLGRPASGQDWLADYKRKYCLDADFIASVDSKRAAVGNEFGAPYSEARITYHEPAAAARPQPVHVVVDKGDPYSLISLCGEDIRKIGPTQFGGTAMFQPDGSFSVLILKKLPPRPE